MFHLPYLYLVSLQLEYPNQTLIPIFHVMDIFIGIFLTGWRIKRLRAWEMIAIPILLLNAFSKIASI